MKNNKIQETDVLLIGAGIMSATLGTFISLLEPTWKIKVYERLDAPGLESSDSLNNAGTGHSGFCELNYTPEKSDGQIDISKAIGVNESFEKSKQFWSYLVMNQMIDSEFINSTPHMSFVQGEENVEYLKKRHQALIKSPLFNDMKFSTDFNQIRTWTPLICENRNESDHIAVTRMERGTDVDFGLLTRNLMNNLQKKGTEINLNHDVYDLEKEGDKWIVSIKNNTTNKKIKVRTKFLFIGAGGFALTLLEKSGIKEANGYGGFPVSGQWLICKNQDVINKHSAKVYGKASVGAPPMSVPHLDTRIINGEKTLLFGPYAGFSTKFLKEGSALDLVNSIKSSNIITMFAAGAKNVSLTKYLVSEVMKGEGKKFELLKSFMPTAKEEDWELGIAGQRVQVIKKDEKQGAVIEFGTEIVSSADGSIAALLGASPGASTSVSIMLDLLEKCFKDKSDWTEIIQKIIPSHKKSLNKDEYLFYKIEAQTSSVLGLNGHEKIKFN